MSLWWNMLDGNATMYYVIGALHASFYERDDGGCPYYPLEDDKKVEWSDRGDENECEDGDSVSSKE